MDLNQHAKYYRKSVDEALKVDFEMMSEWDNDLSDDMKSMLDDETKCMIVLRDTLRRLANEAEARIVMRAELISLLKG